MSKIKKLENFKEQLIIEKKQKEEEIFIETNQKGAIAIEQLCDVALKAGGLQNFNAIGLILSAIN